MFHPILSTLRRYCCQLKIALVAYKNTVLNAISLLWVQPDSPPAVLDFFFFKIPVNQMCSFSGTPGGSVVGNPSLIDKSLVNNPRVGNASHNKPPENGWYRNAYGDYYLFRDKKHTGMIIFRTRSVFIPSCKEELSGKYISLGRYYYRVSFLPNLPLKKEPIIETYRVIESSSITEAKKMGEWFYRKWLEYNQ